MSANKNANVSNSSSFDDVEDAAGVNQEDDSSPTFVSNPNLTEDAQEVDHQERNHDAPSWVRKAQVPPRTPPSVPTVAGSAATASAPDSGFVFVTRPLPSIRLKDPWASGENLPGITPPFQKPPTTHTTLPVTQIRRNLIDRSAATTTNGSSSPTNCNPPAAASAGAPGSNGLFDVEVFAEGEDGERTVITPGGAFLDLYDPQTNEFILVIEQKSFYHDVLASFSTADEIKSAREERYRLREIQEEANNKRTATNAGSRSWFSWRSIPPVVSRARQQQLIAGGGINEESTDASGMLTESHTYESMLTSNQQATKTAAEGATPTSPHDSAPTLSQAQWEKVWKQFKCDIGRENFCVGGKRIVNPDVALVELNELFETFAVDLRDFARQQQEKDNKEALQKQKQKATTPSSASVIGSSLWYALAFPVELASWSTKLFISNSAASSAASPSLASYQDNSPSSDAAASASENTAALAGALSRMVILLSQQSVLALPYELFVRQFVDSDQLNGAAIYVGETRYDERATSDESLRGGMRVNVHRAPAYEAFCQQARRPSSDSNTAPPPPSSPLREVSSSIDDSHQSATIPLTSKPSIYITIEKEFRVFSIPHDDVDDRTLFHISAQISFCITDGGDVVQLRWLLNPPPHSTSSAPPPPAPLSPNSVGAGSGDEEGHVPLPRRCDCLGASSGFHRGTCPLRGNNP